MLYMLSPPLYCNNFMITKEPQETADDGWFIWLFCNSKQENNQGKHGRQRPEQTEKSNLEETMIIQGDKNTHKSYQ